MPMYRKLPSNKIQAVVQIKGYPQHSKTFPNKQAAKLWAVKLEQSLRVGELDDTGLTIPDIISQYMQSNEGRSYHKKDMYTATKQQKLWSGVKANEFSLLHLNVLQNQELFLSM